MYRNHYYRNAIRNIPPNQHYVVPFVQNPPYNSFYSPFRNLPPVNTKLFIKSAKCLQNLMSSADVVVNRFVTSPKFSNDMMTAAQSSNIKQVDKLIQSLGLKNKPTISYSPDGISIQFDAMENNFDICHLTLKIRWG